MGGKQLGQQSCGKNCVICRRMYNKNSMVQGIRRTCTYDRTIGCRSFNVIYGIWCEKCNCVCYVGETGCVLYSRIANHLSTIRTSNTHFPVSAHFHSPGHSLDDMLVVGLERVWGKDAVSRRVREQRWVDLLGTNHFQGGLNVKKK